MTERFTFRKFRMEDLAGYTRFFSSVYSKDIDDNFFRWKHLRNPNRDSEVLIYLVLNEEGRIIAANSFFPAKLIFQRREFLIVQSGDTMVSKEYRRRGFFKKVLEYATEDLKEKGYGAILGIPNNNSLPGLKSVGFENLYTMNRFTRILNYENVLASRVQNVPGIRMMGRTIDWFDDLLSFRKCDSYDVQKYDLSDEALFVEAVKRTEKYVAHTCPDRIHQIKEPSHLKWKYNEKPDSQYEMIVIKNGGTIIAVLIVRIEEHLGNKSGHVVEYFIDKVGNFDVVIKCLLNYYKLNHFDYLSVWDFGDENLRRVCKKNLFIERDANLHFTVKVLDDNLKFLYDLTLWHIVQGDADTA